MSDSLNALEDKRQRLLREFSELGDLRPGSITATRGTCGTANCHCHRAGDPGHGPNLRLTYKVDGKTVTETFPTLAAQRKAEREVAEFRNWWRRCIPSRRLRRRGYLPALIPPSLGHPRTERSRFRSYQQPSRDKRNAPLP